MFSSHGFTRYISPYENLPKFLKSVILVQLIISLYHNLSFLLTIYRSEIFPTILLVKYISNYAQPILLFFTSPHTPQFQNSSPNRVILPLSYIPQQDTSLMKQQVVVTHRILQTEIPAFLDSLVTMSCPQKHVCPYIFFKKIKCLSVGLLRISQFFMSLVKICIGGLRRIVVS